MRWCSLVIALFLSLLAPVASAQELIASVDVNSSQVQGNESLFSTLEESILSLINDHSWTDAKYSPIERIDCGFTIVINTSFSAEIQVQARRPVYNSSYTTSVFSFRDTDFEFEYIEGEPLEYNSNTIESNLVATIVYYVYMILGADSDSFALEGGGPYFQQAMNIVTAAQTQMGWGDGWAAFSNPNNRHGLVTAFTEERQQPFRQLWYTYHRKGLDEMVANSDRARASITELVPQLEELRQAQPNTPLIQFFALTKLDELVLVYSKSNDSDKKKAYEALSNLFPADVTRLEPLKKK